MKKIKILFVIGSLDYCNGITSYAMNYYNNLNKELFEIDFAVHYQFETEYSKAILQNGNKIFFMGDYSLKSMLGLKKRIRRLYKDNHYDIVHCHILNVSYFYFSEAKKAGIKVRILHSHATKNSDNVIKNARNKFLKALGLKYTTDRFACSRLAGDYLFGKKSYTVVKNAVDYDKFSYKKDQAKLLRPQFNIQDETLCLGFIGRFTNQKNIFFLIEIAKELKNRRCNFKMLLIGDGDLKDRILNSINGYGLNNYIAVIDTVKDVNRYYSMFDIFLLPSLFEGMPLTGIEAQVAGNYCLFADTITTELNFTGNCKFLSIQSAGLWANEIIGCFAESPKRDVPDDYDVCVQAAALQNIYTDLVGKQ